MKDILSSMFTLTSGGFVLVINNGMKICWFRTVYTNNYSVTLTLPVSYTCIPTVCVTHYSSQTTDQTVKVMGADKTWVWVGGNQYNMNQNVIVVGM